MKHIGKIVHKDMTQILEGKGGKDKDAHSSHHEANKHHGMDEGMQPKDGRCEGGKCYGGGAPSMESNECD